MCVICLQFELGKLTRFESRSALTELINTDGIDTDHVQEVLKKLEKVEEESTEEEDTGEENE